MHDPRRHCSRLAATLLAAFFFAATAASAAPERRLDQLVLPAGFEVEVWADGVTNARSLALGPNGLVFVGSQRAGKVYAVADRDGDGRAEKIAVVAEDLFMPNGVAYRDGSLYVAEVNRILRFDDIAQHLDNPPEPVVLRDDLPDERHHGWKFIRFGPDGKLYVPVGAPCNVCEVEDPFAALLRMNPDGSGQEVFARGIRNTVGFDWNPATGVLWFTDNGRDMLGNDIPPDELNRAPEAGLHFGYPFCHGAGIPDPELGDEQKCREQTPPARELGPHVAAVGMRFYDGTSFPPEYRGHVLIAEHGSWNRTEPIGYRLSRVTVEDGTATSYEVFVEGWLQGKKAWGRPADLAVLEDGSILVADDMQGVIYRISYAGD
jgi:glucose/arabinose dehydrogenase